MPEFRIFLAPKNEGIEYEDASGVYRFGLSRKRGEWQLHLPGSKGEAFEEHELSQEEADRILPRIVEYLSKIWWFGVFPRSYTVTTTRPNEHPVLGKLVYVPDVAAWRCTGGPGSFGFLIAGRTEPDRKLLAHAADLRQQSDRFLELVNRFLVREAAKQPRWSDEIRLLTLQEVCLLWPRRPNDGMLYFSSGNESGRLWRSDYINRKPVGLGFDS